MPLRHSDDVPPGQLPSDDALCIGSDLSILWANARPWSPPLPRQTAPIPSSFSKFATMAPADGVARAVLTGKVENKVKAVAGALDDIFRGSAVDVSPFVPLVGRGPGLTPSGDDLLGGILVALHTIGRADLAVALWEQLAPQVRQRTHAISHALLCAAAQGEGSDTLHRAINACLSDENPAPALAGLAQIGHSSGWDAFAGVALVFHAAYQGATITA